MYVAMDENMLMWSNQYGWVPDIQSADFFTSGDIERMSLPLSTTSVEWVQLFDIDQLQFARLIAEAQMAGAFTEEVMADMCDSMDLEPEEITQVIDRAITAYDRFKERITG